MKKEKTSVHQFRTQKTWENMLSEAQLMALKPFIRAEVDAAGRQILAQISSVLLQSIAEIRLRSLALESILKAKATITDEDITDAMNTEEDKLTGYEVVDTVEANDLVRIDLTITTSEGTSPSQKIAIIAVTKEAEPGVVQTVKELENALVGLKAGEEKTVTVASDKGEVTYHAKVKRVSRKRT
jgi:FKBP-type peptidyl-prolyl cis-trans isomerase (trigger factor)